MLQHHLQPTLRQLLSQYGEQAVRLAIDEITQTQPKKDQCERCGTAQYNSGFCRDITCPRSDHIEFLRNGEVITLRRPEVTLLLSSQDGAMCEEVDIFESLYHIFLSKKITHIAFDALFSELQLAGFSDSEPVTTLIDLLDEYGEDHAKFAVKRVLSYCDTKSHFDESGNKTRFIATLNEAELLAFREFSAQAISTTI